MFAGASVACLRAVSELDERLFALIGQGDTVRSSFRLANAARDLYLNIARTIISERSSQHELYVEASQRLHDLMDVARAGASPAGTLQLDRIQKSTEEIDRLVNEELVPAVRAGDRASLVELNARLVQIALRMREDAETLVRRSEFGSDALARDLRGTQHRTIHLIVLSLILAALAVVISGLYLQRSLASAAAPFSSTTPNIRTAGLLRHPPSAHEDGLARLAQPAKEQQDALLDRERLVTLASISAGIAHELKTPIGVILGYAQLLRREEIDMDTTVAAALEEGALLCHRTIESVLDLARGGPLRPAPVDLRMLVDTVVRALRVNGVAATTTIETHGRSMAQGEEQKLRQVITNLLTNAAEASGTHGRVAVVLGYSPHDTATVDVLDTGAGLSERSRARLFEPFFTTKPTGCGLGLPISRAIARAHGGDLVVISTGASGTMFRLTLPAVAEAS